MPIRAHRCRTRTFDELETRQQKSRSINAQVTHVEDAIENEMRSFPSEREHIRQVRIAQLRRLIDKLSHV